MTAFYILTPHCPNLRDLTHFTGMKNSYSTHSTVEIYNYEILLHLTFILYYIKASGFNLLRTSVPYLHNCFQIFQDTSCQMLVVAPLPLYVLANSDPEFRSSRILIWSSGLAEGNTIPFHYNARPDLLSGFATAHIHYKS